MKKTKKNIKQFQQALLTNTGFIKQSEESEPIPAAQYEAIIEDEILQKFTFLAEYEGTHTKELINKALNHFLLLKSLQLEEAMKKQKD